MTPYILSKLKYYIDWYSLLSDREKDSWKGVWVKTNIERYCMVINSTLR
jgi:hypothetical protein